MLSILSSSHLLNPLRIGEKPCPEEKLSWLGRSADWIFDFGQKSYNLYPLRGRLVACPFLDKRCRSWIEIAIKVLLIATFIIPLVALAGKWIHRSANKIIATEYPDPIFTLFEAASLIEDPGLREEALFHSEMVLYPDDFERRVEEALSNPHPFIKNDELMKLSSEKAKRDPKRAFSLINLIDNREIKHRASMKVLALILPDHQESAHLFISSVREESRRAVYLSLLAASIHEKWPARAKQLVVQAVDLIINVDEPHQTDACVKAIPFLYKVDHAVGQEIKQRACLIAKNHERPYMRVQALSKLAKCIPVPAEAVELVDEAALEAENEGDLVFREWALKKLSKTALSICRERAIRIIDEKISLPHIRAVSRATAAVFEARLSQTRAREFLNLSKLDIESIRGTILRSACLEEMMTQVAKADLASAFDMMQTLQDSHEKQIAGEAVILEMAVTAPQEALLLAKAEEGPSRDRLLLNIVRKIVDRAG
ncbi:hypothetical protein [Estrella lausannensis]|uniref:Uncharacterized protein n=1 Tax=Estrella lausannensis TaxID=483423 RepID=A0A0H5E367_9BACT|nr:hypothetical protein [Estrella lausannensis]CRX37640.1 hypothetical protein ELAC_0279 [Estrella lausannensis]